MTPTEPGPLSPFYGPGRDPLDDDQHRVCDCGRAIRGQVPDQLALIGAGPLFATLSPTVPAHFCLQCSPAHCKMRAFIVDQFANTDHPLDRAPE